MVYLILKSYMSILLSVGIGAIFIFMLGLWLILKVSTQERGSSAHENKLSAENLTAMTITSQDINAIAGDDIIATQLDLARAYIETGRKKLALKILEYVVNEGSAAQQEEAKILLNLI